MNGMDDAMRAAIAVTYFVIGAAIAATALADVTRAGLVVVPLLVAAPLAGAVTYATTRRRPPR